jgi:sugar O-acyltransferase (sialic acid O-acetyltransferase NeuD family)
MTEVILIGAGGHGKVVLDAVLSNPNTGIKIIGFLDDGDIKEIHGIKKLGNIKDFVNFKDKKFHIAIGNNVFRERLSKEIGENNLVTIIHKTAYVSSMSNVGNGSYIGAILVINPQCKIGKGCIVNTGTIVEHDCYIGDYSHLSYRVLVGSESKISSKTMIDMGKILERNSNM